MRHIAAACPASPRQLDARLRVRLRRLRPAGEQPAVADLARRQPRAGRDRIATTATATCSTSRNTAPGLDLRWDWRDMIRALDLQGGGDAFYNYGIDKQRTRKRIERNRRHHRGPHLPRRLRALPPHATRRTRRRGDRVAPPVRRRAAGAAGRRRAASRQRRPGPNGLTVKEQTLFRYQYGNHLGPRRSSSTKVPLDLVRGVPPVRNERVSAAECRNRGAGEALSVHRDGTRRGERLELPRGPELCEPLMPFGFFRPVGSRRRAQHIRIQREQPDQVSRCHGRRSRWRNPTSSETSALHTRGWDGGARGHPPVLKHAFSPGAFRVSASSHRRCPAAARLGEAAKWTSSSASGISAEAGIGADRPYVRAETGLLRQDDKPIAQSAATRDSLPCSTGPVADQLPVRHGALVYRSCVARLILSPIFVPKEQRSRVYFLRLPPGRGGAFRPGFIGYTYLDMDEKLAKELQTKQAGEAASSKKRKADGEDRPAGRRPVPSP